VTPRSNAVVLLLVEEKLSGATSETTVELALTALLNGDYNIQVGLPDRPHDVVACGDVPQEVAESCHLGRSGSGAHIR
jgi:hypothetical protein